MELTRILLESGVTGFCRLPYFVIGFFFFSCFFYPFVISPPTLSPD